MKSLQASNVNLSMPRHKANESLRPGKPRSHADIFGIEGSFRRLRSSLSLMHIHIEQIQAIENVPIFQVGY